MFFPWKMPEHIGLFWSLLPSAPLQIISDFPLINLFIFPGNILAFLVMLQTENRKLSTCVYMCGLCVSDSIMIAWSCVYYANHQYMWRPHDQILCKTSVLCAFSAITTGTWLIIAMTTDRFLAIKFPHLVSIISTPKKAKLVVLFIFIIGHCYNIPHYFWSLKIGPHKECTSYATTAQLAKIYAWLSFVINGAIPFSLLISFNAYIIYKIKHRKDKFNNSPSTTMKNTKSVERQLTIMLIGVCVVFFICYAPMYFRFIWGQFVNIYASPESFAFYYMIYHLSARLYYTNSIVNFYIYFLTGQKFRKDVKNALLAIIFCRQIKQDNQIKQPSSIGPRTTIRRLDNL